MLSLSTLSWIVALAVLVAVVVAAWKAIRAAGSAAGYAGAADVYAQGAGRHAATAAREAAAAQTAATTATTASTAASTASGATADTTTLPEASRGRHAAPLRRSPAWTRDLAPEVYTDPATRPTMRPAHHRAS